MIQQLSMSSGFGSKTGKIDKMFSLCKYYSLPTFRFSTKLSRARNIFISFAYQMFVMWENGLCVVYRGTSDSNVYCVITIEYYFWCSSEKYVEEYDIF